MGKEDTKMAIRNFLDELFHVLLPSLMDALANLYRSWNW